MPILIFKSFSRHLHRHPWQLGLAVLGITVGVAVIVAIRLTQHSAFDAFDTATRTTVGSASHQLVGSNGWLNHNQIRQVMQSFPQIPMSPVLSRTVSLPEHANISIGLLGIEPISRAQISTAGTPETVLFDPRKLISEPLSAVLNRFTADQLEVEIGSKINVKIGDKFSPLTIIDVLPPADLAGGIINNLLVVDIATAQEVFEFYDGVDHLNLRIDDAEILSEINTLIDSGKLADIELVDLSAQASRIKRMTAAFYSNLTALSLMALLVGMFLIYNTETFLVLQRRAILGRLRALGVSRRQILIAILVEAAAIGTIGSLSGIALGILLANGLLGIVSTTINDLYFDAPIQSLSIDPTTLIVSLLIGVAATLFAALVPALDAIRMEPNLVISRTGLRPFKVRQICIVTSIVFVLCNLLAVVVLTHSQSPSAGFAGICLVVLGFAALCPMAIIALSSIARRLIGSSRLLPERLGLRTVSVTLNRTGTATAALMIATAASIGIGVMVTSFRVSVADWLDSALRAEVYIADGQFDNRFRDKKIPQLVIKKLEQLPEVIATSNVLRRQVYSAQERIQVSVFTLNSIAKRGFKFTVGEADLIWRQWHIADVIIVTEPYAYHHGISVGDQLALKTDRGEQQFKVVGIYRDYASERGNIALSRTTFDRHWQSSGYDGIGVYGDPAVSLDRLTAAIATALDDHPSLVINSTDKLKRTSMAVFDRTFLITELLRAIAVTVSFIGVLGALLAQQLERTQEYGILRAIGFKNIEMSRTVLTQTTLLGATAALIAVPVGILIGVILIDVINPRSFGWTMSLQIPPPLIFKSCAVALLAALLAGLYPSYRAARIEPADAMRYE